MPEMVRLCAVSELPAEDEVKEFTCGGKTVCVANLRGEYAALDGVCAHRGGPLGQGVILNGQVVCPWHGWMFHPRTGVSHEDPQCRVAVYHLEIVGEDVMIMI